MKMKKSFHDIFFSKDKYSYNSDYCDDKYYSINNDEFTTTTYLSWISMFYSYIEVKKFLEADIKNIEKINTTDIQGNTPLNNVIKKVYFFDNKKSVLTNDRKVIEILLRYGGSVNINNRERENPLSVMSKTKIKLTEIDVLLFNKMLRKSENQTINNKDILMKTPLINLCENYSHCKYRKEMIESIVMNYHCDLNSVDKFGRTALHCISEFLNCNNNTINICRLLINRGADVDIKDNHGWTPLIFAIVYMRSGNMKNSYVGYLKTISNLNYDKNIEFLKKYITD